MEKINFKFEEFILAMEIENVVGFLRHGEKDSAVDCYLDAREYYEENKGRLLKYSSKLNGIGIMLGI